MRALRSAALALVLVLPLAARGETEECPRRFVRFEQKALEGRLETATVGFVHSASRTEVALVGVVHIAERAYYEDIQRDLDGRDAVFYEGLTGSFEPVDRAIECFKALGRAFQLDQQSHVMRRGPSFVHADLSLDELTRAMGAESLAREVDAGGLAALEDVLKKHPRNDHLKWAAAEGLTEAEGKECKHVVLRRERCFSIV